MPEEIPDPKSASDGAKPKPAPVRRREILRAAAWGGGIAGLGGLAGFAASRLRGGKKPKSGATPALGKEFTYDVTRFQKSDPALVRCVEAGRFPVALDRPRNIAVGADGAVYVAGDGGIQKFTSDGKEARRISLQGPVYSVAVRPSGGILAGVDRGIVILDASGVESARWGAFPDGLLPTAIALSGDIVFVADADNRVVLKLDGTGRTLAVIGKRDRESGAAGFVVPSPYFCVRMAPDGLLRVANPGAHRIEAYEPDGRFQLAWGKASFAPDGFCGCCNPVSFDIFSDGSFVTCEKGLPRVKLYDSHGEFTGLVAGPEAFPEYLNSANAGSPDSVGSGLYTAIDPQGRILVLDVIGKNVRVYKMKEDAE